MSKAGVVSIVGLMAVLLVAAAWSQTAGKSVRIQRAFDHDLYAAGEEVEVLADVDGDAVLAGRLVIVDGEIAGDLIAAAETVEIRGAVLDDVRAAGRLVRLEADVGGHVVAAGAEVRLERGRSIGDWVWLAGNRLEVAASVGGGLKAAGNTVVLSGTIGGDAEIIAETIRIEPGALVQGNLYWASSGEPEVSSEARIAGDIIQRPLPGEEDEDARRGDGFLASLVFTLSLMIAAVVAFFLFPGFALAAVAGLRAEPWVSLGLGLVVLVVTPVAITLLAVTGVGALLALALLMLYALVLLAGVLTGLISLGDIVAGWAVGPEALSRGWRIASIVGAIAAVALLKLVPLLGTLLVMAVWLFGTGALVLQAVRRYRAPALV